MNWKNGLPKKKKIFRSLKNKLKKDLMWLQILSKEFLFNFFFLIYII